jgi:uncharacterized protein YndB with AHSA1/START domain
MTHDPRPTRNRPHRADIAINAPRPRVWRALSNAEEFGTWFGVNLKGKTFAPGQRVQDLFTIEGHETCMFDIVVERVESEKLLSYRWHPYSMDPAVDYEQEPRTLVTFALQDTADGTLLTVVETGFDQVPPERRFEAFRINSSGWEWQLGNLQRHVSAR